MSRRIARTLLLLLVAAGIARVPGARAQPPGTGVITLTVTEHGGVDRAGAPVTSGVPVPAELAGGAWALFDGPTQVPLQTTLLPARGAPWLLLDFQTTLAAGATRTYTLRPQFATAAPATPVTVVEDAQRITVTTGPLRVEVGRQDFNLVDRAWLDRDGDGQFAGGEQVVFPAAGANLTARAAGGALDHVGRGRPSRIEWEDRGPLRATLRVDGAFTLGTDTLLHYTTRLTWWAGRSVLRIEHVLRNSLAARERYVKLSSARLALGGGATSRAERSGALVWTAFAAPGAVLELIPATVMVSTAYDPGAVPPVPRTNSVVNVDANGGLVLGDLSHHGAVWHLDFDPLAAGERTRRTVAAADPLLALADAAHYSALGAFGQERFGSYEDEKATYTRWGWTWPTPGNPWSYEHQRPRAPDLHASWSLLDATNDPESDDLWENLVMAARVRIPLFLDRARAWLRYLRWEWTFRTDGFEYAGAWGAFADGPGTASRLPVLKPALTVLDTLYVANNIKRGKAGTSHLWNGGLLDAYYLTGDRDALEAALDVAEQARRFMGWRTTGVGGNARFQARCLLVLTRAWEATGDPRWRAAADHAAGQFTTSTRYDPRGFFFGSVDDMGPAFTSRFAPGSKLVTPFMMAAVVQALHRYWLATDSPAVRAQLLQIATFARDHGLDPATRYCGDELVVDSPAAGDVLHLSVSQWRNETPIVPYVRPSSSVSFINALVIGHRLTGDRSFLDRAKLHWNQATKREYYAPYGELIATDSQVGRFASSLQNWPANSLIFPYAGDLTGVSLLFHDAARADTTAPRAILDLRRE